MYLLFIANSIKYNAYFRWTGPARYEKRDKKPKVQYTYIYVHIFYHHPHPPPATPKKSVIQLQKFFFIIMYTGKF